MHHIDTGTEAGREERNMETSMDKNISNIFNTAVKVITNPADFYGGMPKAGGFVDPLIFMVVMGVITGVVNAVLSLVGIGFAKSFFMALASIVWIPIMAAVFSFIMAAILFVLWKIMGSRESYETAYRCGAYAGAIAPITAVLNLVPYIGPIIGLVWSMFLMVVASREVHKINPKTAWIVFGVIFAFLALTSTCSQFAAKKVQREMGDWQQKFENMTPEEAGKAMGEFLKGMEEEMKKEK